MKTPKLVNKSIFTINDKNVLDEKLKNTKILLKVFEYLILFFISISISYIIYSSDLSYKKSLDISKNNIENYQNQIHNNNKIIENLEKNNYEISKEKEAIIIWDEEFDLYWFIGNEWSLKIFLDSKDLKETFNKYYKKDVILEHKQYNEYNISNINSNSYYRASKNADINFKNNFLDMIYIFFPLFFLLITFYSIILDRKLLIEYRLNNL